MTRLFSRIVVFAVVLLGALILIACQLTDQDVTIEESTGIAPPGAESPVSGADGPAPETSSAEAESNATGWQRLDTTGGGGQTGIATHPGDADIVYMSSDNGGLFKTENGGDSWFSVSSNLGAYRLGFVTLDPLNPDVVYVAASTDYGTITAGGALGEIHRSLNGGLSWQFVSDAMGFQNSFPNQKSIVIPFDPAEPGRFDRDNDRLSDVMLVGAWSGPASSPSGGIWRSVDEGASFSQLGLDGRNVTGLYAFSADYRILFATTYEGEIFRSEDLGETWSDITGNMPLAHPADLAVHPTDDGILYVTCRWCRRNDPPVWKTIDGGRNWFPASAGLDTGNVESFPRILIDRFDPDTLYLTTHQALHSKSGVYKTTDAGESWQRMPARLVLPDGRPYYWLKFEGGLAIGQAIDGRLFAGGGGGWRYPDGDPNDGLEVWEPATIGVGNIAVNTIEVDPHDGAVLYQGIGDYGPYKSVDRGSSFYRILGNGWPVTVGNFSWSGPYYNSYETCRLQCSPVCRTREALAVGSTTAFAVSRQDSNVVYSAFGSRSGGVGQGGVNKSEDGGKTWRPLGVQLQHGFYLDPQTCVPYEFDHLAIDPTNDEIVFAAMKIPPTGTGKLYKTIDGGRTWSEVYSGPGYVTGLAVSAADPNLVVFATRNDVFKSEDGGEAGSWQRITPAGVAQIQTVELSPHLEQVFVAGTNDQGLYFTANGGLTWHNYPLADLFDRTPGQSGGQDLAAGLAAAVNPNAPVLKNISAIVFDPLEPDTFYVGGTQYTRASFGVAKITSSGQKWQRLTLEGLSHRNVFDLAIDSTGTFLYAGTFDGIYRLKLR